MEKKTILVKEHPDYQIDEDFLETLLFESYETQSNSVNFFERSLKFYREVKEKDVELLSEKQKNWLWELNCVLHDREEQKLAQEQEFKYLKQAQEKLENSIKPETFLQKTINKLKKLLK